MQDVIVSFKDKIDDDEYKQGGSSQSRIERENRQNGLNNFDRHDEDDENYNVDEYESFKVKNSN